MRRRFGQLLIWVDIFLGIPYLIIQVLVYINPRITEYDKTVFGWTFGVGGFLFLMGIYFVAEQLKSERKMSKPEKTVMILLLLLGLGAACLAFALIWSSMWHIEIL